MLARPRKTLKAIAYHVNGQLLGRSMQLFAKVARRTSTSLFAVGHDDNKARLVAEVEHIGRLLTADISGVRPAGVKAFTARMMGSAAFGVGLRSSLTLHCW